MAPPTLRIGRLSASGVIGDQRRYRLPRARPDTVTLRYHPLDLR
jgi:hypothetical protein